MTRATIFSEAVNWCLWELRKMSALLLSILSVGISFVVSFFMVPLCCFLARRLQFIDKPDGVVKQHAQAVPYLGGVAVYGGFIFATLIFAHLDYFFLLFLSGATMLLFVGLIDDLYVLSPLQKLFGQIMAALLFLKSGFYIKEGFLYSKSLSFLISFFWIVSLSNAFNLVDVMDGLATTIALCSAITFLFFAFLLDSLVAIIVLSSLLGSLIAFFWYNRPPAQIYLGDAGALFIGGVLAVTPFFLKWEQYNNYGYVVPIIVLAIPLLELTSLVVVRTYKGVAFYKPTPDHFSLYLLRNGWSKQGILAYVFSLSLVLGVTAALFLFNFICSLTTIIIGFLFLIVWCAVIGDFLR